MAVGVFVNLILNQIISNTNSQLLEPASNLKLPTPSEIENHIAKLQESLALMHKSIVQTSSNERQAHRNSDKKFRQKPNFTMCDYVLIGIAKQHSNQKLYLKWRGPNRVIDTLNNYVFQVEHLITKEQKQIHGVECYFTVIPD